MSVVFIWEEDESNQPHSIIYETELNSFSTIDRKDVYSNDNITRITLPSGYRCRLSHADASLATSLLITNNHDQWAVLEDGRVIQSTESFPRSVLAPLDKLIIEEKTSIIFSDIHSALQDFKNGRLLIVVDNEDRENEGDLIIAAEDITVTQMAFMIRHTTGIICCPMSEADTDRLNLPLMISSQGDPFGTAFTITVDAKFDTTTGVSAHDRTKTARLLANSKSTPLDFVRPGHVFPLRARNGGVLEREGHTEAAVGKNSLSFLQTIVDLCRLTGKRPVAVIAEIMLDDGTMARRKDLIAFSRQYGLKIITIESLKAYLMSRQFIQHAYKNSPR